MKKSLFLLTLCIMMGTAASAYDFVSVCPTGQRLGYYILSNNPPEVVLMECLDFEGGVTIPETVSLNFTDYTVVSIAPQAFKGGCLSYNFSGPLVIPNTVREIGARAFWDCWFTGPLVIPNSVEIIGESAFYGCRKFTSLTLSESLTEIENNTFCECDEMRGDLVIPESVIWVDNEGFNRCAFDGTLYLSPNMPYVLTGSFMECYNLTGIVIPEGVQFVDWNAFDFLTKPTELELPSTLSFIEDRAFCNLVKLTQMTVNATTPPGIMDETFQRVNHNIPVYIPIGTKEAYENAPNWSEFTNFIELAGVGLAEQESEATAMIYPNPGKNVLNIRTRLKDARVEVYDMNGRMIHKQEITDNITSINTERWPTGAYIWKVMADGKEAKSGKWIKQ